MSDKILTEVKTALDERAKMGWPDLEASGADWMLALSVHLGAISQSILTSDAPRYRRTLTELAASSVLAIGCLDRSLEAERAEAGPETPQ
jgi:hypothetical protein